MALLSFGAVAHASSSLREVAYREEEAEIALQQQDEVVDVPCNGNDQGPQYSFALDIQLTPQGGHDPNWCSTRKKKALQEDLNEFLLEYGVGEQGRGDNTAFLAEVCDTSFSGRRRLAGSNFRYYGGGVCRFCLWDNLDGRRLRNDDPYWFANVFKPELQNLVRNKFTETVARNHWACLGSGPRVEVDVSEIDEAPNTDYAL